MPVSKVSMTCTAVDVLLSSMYNKPYEYDQNNPTYSRMKLTKDNVIMTQEAHIVGLYFPVRETICPPRIANTDAPSEKGIKRTPDAVALAPRT
jgi:hypothetical protein